MDLIYLSYCLALQVVLESVCNIETLVLCALTDMQAPVYEKLTVVTLIGLSLV